MVQENISSKGHVVKETFHLPFAYKYDNFCDFVTYTEDYATHKQVGYRAEIQPFKMKLR